jgi:small GTP-binding protein
MSKKYDYMFKYIIIGDTAVGKSNLVLRYVYNEFKPDYNITIGLEFGEKEVKIKNKTYKIQIWDTAGQEKFKSITRTYYKNCVCAIIVYDITKRDTFDNVINWVEDCKNNSPKTVFMVLVGNKSDLDDKREVNADEAKDFADNNGMLFFETSAKNGNNVKEIFLNSVEQIIKNMERDYYDLDNEECGIQRTHRGKTVLENKKNKKKGCC